MPIYEFQCRQCEREFELLIRGSESPTCPECGSPKLEKLLSTSAAYASGKRASLPVAGGCPYSGTSQCDPERCQMQE